MNNQTKKPSHGFAVGLGIIALMAAGCILVRGLVRTDGGSDSIEKEKVVVASVPVNWSEVRQHADFDNSRFASGGLILNDGIELLSVFPTEELTQQWNFRKLKLLFRGVGRFAENPTRATVEVVVEMKVVPHEHFRLQVSHTDNVVISLFEADGKAMQADVSDATAAFSDRVGNIAINFDGHEGVKADDLVDGKAWFHNDHVEFNVRKIK